MTDVAPSRRCASVTKACTSVVVMPSRMMRAAALWTSSVISLAFRRRAISTGDFSMRQAAVMEAPLTKSNLLPALRMPSKVKNGVAGSTAIVLPDRPSVEIVSTTSAVGSSCSSQTRMSLPNFNMERVLGSSKAGLR